MSRRLLVIACLSLATVFDPPPCSAALSGENLLTPIPAGFKVGYKAGNDKILMQEFVPAVETVEDWSRIVTAQIFLRRSNWDPDDFAQKLSGRWQSVCSGGDARGFHRGVENGFPVTLWAFSCPLNPKTKRPETMYLKAISGADSFYVVQYAFHQETNKALTEEAVGYLKKVSACDTRRVDRPCPAGM